MTVPRSCVWPEAPLHAAELVAECLCLQRALAQAQRQSVALAAHWQARCERAEAESMRLRARLVVAQTRRLWALPGDAFQRASPWPRAAVHLRWSDAAAVAGGEPGRQASPEVRQMLCQVACHGHAHVWLRPDGCCALDGRGCLSLNRDAALCGAPSDVAAGVTPSKPV